MSQWGISDAAVVADARMFVGMVAQITNIGNVNPSSLLNIIGVGADSTESSLSLMTNDGSGVATKTALGADFPADTRSTDWYELYIESPPSTTDVFWRLIRMNTGHVAQGTVTTDLPATTVALTSQVWRNNGATALAAAMDIGFIAHGRRL
jgi:hypothetical protein